MDQLVFKKASVKIC